MSQEEPRIEDDGPRETKVSASVRYFSELGDKKRKKMRYIMALNGEEGPIHFYSKYINQTEGVKKAKLEKSLVRISPDGFSWVKVGGTDKKRLKPETIHAAFKEAPVFAWQTIITWDTHAKLEEFRIIFKNLNADVKKEEEERKKKEELLKKQQSKLKIVDKVPPGCVMYRFKSSMFKEISDCVNETIMNIQRTKGLAQVDLDRKEESEEKKDMVTRLPELQVDESNRRRRNRSASLGSKDDDRPNSARSHGSNHAGQAGQASLGIPPPKRKHAGSNEGSNHHHNHKRRDEDRENIFMEATYHPSTGTHNDMMSSYIPMADTFGGF